MAITHHSLQDLPPQISGSTSSQYFAPFSSASTLAPTQRSGSPPKTLPCTRAVEAAAAGADANAGLVGVISPASQAKNINPVRAPTPDEALVELPGISMSSHSPPVKFDTGWRPWKVVLGGFCLTVPTYGLLSSVGLFKTYWEEHQLRNGSYTDSEISWIISMFGFLVCLFASPSGMLFDRYGHAWMLGVSTAVYVGAFVGLAFCSTYQQFMTCLVIAGLAGGMYGAYNCFAIWLKSNSF